VLSHVNEQNRYSFDQNCRVKALTLASGLGLAETGARLSINFMPGAVYSPAACLRLTLKTAEEVGFPTDRLIFELTENEELTRPEHLRAIISEYQRHGFRVAIDDFGAGHSGLTLFADLPVDVIKLDMALTRNLHQRPRTMAIIRGIVGMAAELGTEVVGEGVETLEELDAIRDCGVSVVQGYLFAKPAFEALPRVQVPARLRLVESPLHAA
jgi:EAL domain-containing protein (putative c-di-GMP-specific phosphodiesterase class I)